MVHLQGYRFRIRIRRDYCYSYCTNQFRNVLYETRRYCDKFGSCAFCDYIKYELDDGKRVVFTNKHFAVAGFELGSGIYINPLSSEEAAKILKEA